uniref:Uncharacterized protein n=1 Tax=Mycena chlorophos TaxID=658473 RepID=A0ABQ0M5P6_MYCCL|nr:predicted protein [Mycena chlorophos]
MGAGRESTSTTTNPRVPFDLERAIFEQAAFNYPKIMVPTLSLVAWRAYKWVAHIAFHTIVVVKKKTHPPDNSEAAAVLPCFEIDQLLDIIDNPMHSKKREFVQNIILSERLLPLQVGAILKACHQGIYSVAMFPEWVLAQQWPIAPFPGGVRFDNLRHLSVGLYEIMGLLALTPGPSVAILPALTHLQLLSLKQADDLRAKVTQHLYLFSKLPTITHMAAEGLQPDQVMRLLAVCRALRVLVAELPSTNIPEQYAEPEASGQGSRLVLYVAKPEDRWLARKWVDGLLDQEDIWTSAERLLRGLQREGGWKIPPILIP